LVALKAAFKQRSKKKPPIKELRSQRLLLEIELVAELLHPLAEKTAYVINRMKRIWNFNEH
jgi:hypothetical protein